MAKSTTTSPSSGKRPAPAATAAAASKASGKSVPLAPAKVKTANAPKGIAAAAIKGATSAAKGKPSAKVTSAAATPTPTKAGSGKSAAAKSAPSPAPVNRVIIAVPANKSSSPMKVNGKHAAIAASNKVAKMVEVKPSKGDRPKNGTSHADMPPARPIPEAVPTDGKPRKNQAGLNVKELEHFRALLLEKRRELVGDMVSMESEALRSSGGSNLSNLPLHMADMGTDNYEQEFTLGLVEKDRNLLRELNAALAKIQNGTYGICEGTGKPIAKVRLEAQPWARFSIEHARSLERRIR